VHLNQVTWFWKSTSTPNVTSICTSAVFPSLHAHMSTVKPPFTNHRKLTSDAINLTPVYFITYFVLKVEVCLSIYQRLHCFRLPISGGHHK
jgi:hypothetical protein